MAALVLCFPGCADLDCSAGEEVSGCQGWLREVREGWGEAGRGGKFFSQLLCVTHYKGYWGFLCNEGRAHGWGSGEGPEAAKLLLGGQFCKVGVVTPGISIFSVFAAATHFFAVIHGNVHREDDCG